MTSCNVIRLILALLRLRRLVKSAENARVLMRETTQASQDLRQDLKNPQTAPMKKAAAFFSGPAGKITLRRAMHLSPGASESMTQLWIFVESKAHAR
jgi:hypothetical protein